MKKLIIFLFIIAGISAQSQAKKWTLKECVDYALEKNINIKQAELDLDQSEINKKDAFGNFLPTFNTSASHSWNIGLNQDLTTGLLRNQTTQQSSFGVSSNVDIFKGLQNINRMHVANLEILSSQYQLENMKNDISLFVANSFLQVLFNKEQIKVLNSQLEVTTKESERTRELIDAGVLPSGDLLEVQATLSSQEQQLVVAENALFLSKISLAQLLLITDYENFDISDTDYLVPIADILNKSPESIYEKSKETRKEILIAETNAQIAEKELKISKGAQQPSLFGYYNYSTRASFSDQIVGFELDQNNPTQQIGAVETTGDAVVAPNFNAIVGGPDSLFDQFSLNDGHSLGLQLSIPIFNGFAISNNVKRNQINVERSQYLLEQEELNLESTVYQAFNDAKGALKTYEAAVKTLSAREQAFDYSKERYNVGLLNAFDFSQSQNQYVAAQSEVVRTKYDFIFKLKVLEFYFGIPITDIN